FQLPDFPIEPVAVKRIASHIELAFRVDHGTKEGACAKFVRVCSEVDLTKPLLSKHMLEKKILFLMNAYMTYVRHVACMEIPRSFVDGRHLGNQTRWFPNLKLFLLGRTRLTRPFMVVG
ncbi:hypothetical protein LINGRAHAP2_LOCUS4934, partial [Linum grandiflorum]